MAGFLDQFRSKVVQSVWKDQPDKGPDIQIDDKIALGVLMHVVAQADDHFLPQEENKIQEVLKNYGDIKDEEMPYILEAIHQAAHQRIDLHTFTREVSQGLPYDVKIPLVENLFRVACVDNDLAHDEEEMVRKISGLLGLDHRDFINAKIKVKKEFGMDTAGL